MEEGDKYIKYLIALRMKGEEAPTDSAPVLELVKIADDRKPLVLNQVETISRLKEEVGERGECNVKLYERVYIQDLDEENKTDEYCIFLRERNGKYAGRFVLMEESPSGYGGGAWGHKTCASAKTAKHRYNYVRPDNGSKNVIIARPIKYKVSETEEVTIPEFEKEVAE